MFVDEVTDFGKLAVCGCARLSGNLVVVGIILSQLNFSVNFSLVGIKYLQFLIMTFPFSFRTSYDRGRLICFMTMSFLSHVGILTAFSFEIFCNEWVVLPGLAVSVINECCGV